MTAYLWRSAVRHALALALGALCLLGEGCSSGGPVGGSGSGSISMYGTIDQGVTVRK